jgi:glyoxalase family protein
MTDRILGIHHITAIAGDAQRNFDFYRKILGLRFVKKTVNFDDPGTYHFYYGDEQGTPGTILTFFPWKHVRRGKTGTGMATEIGYSIPEGSLDFWLDRFKKNNVKHESPSELLGERYISFEDPDGLNLKFIEPSIADARAPWTTNDIPASKANRGFHSVTIRVRDLAPTASVLKDILGYDLLASEGNVHRYQTNAIETAHIVDLVEDKNGKPGIVAGGTNHHVAFRVKNEEILMRFRDKVEQYGLHITPKIDRNYFFSLYFREPGGVLFEIATDNPGFAVDELPAELGTHLKLPPQYEPQRSKIEQVLPVLQQ